MVLTKNYIINPDTMAIFPMDGPFGELWSIVFETMRMMVIKIRPLKLIDESCAFFGSSYEGRKKGTAAKMKLTHMAPIAMCDSYGMILFPLTSPEKRECIWLAHKHLKDWESNGSDQTQIRFSNHQVYNNLPIHTGTFEMKVYRAAQYRHLIIESVEKYRVTKSNASEQIKLNMNETLESKDNGTFKLKERE